MDYQSRLIEASKDKIFTEHGLTHFHVSHDDHCSVLNNGKVCSCNPDIRFSKNGVNYGVDGFGKIKVIIY